MWRHVRQAPAFAFLAALALHGCAGLVLLGLPTSHWQDDAVTVLPVTLLESPTPALPEIPTQPPVPSQTASVSKSNLSLKEAIPTKESSSPLATQMGVDARPRTEFQNKNFFNRHEFEAKPPVLASSSRQPPGRSASPNEPLGENVIGAEASHGNSDQAAKSISEAMPALPMPGTTASTVDLPSASAEHLHNPPPSYPNLSRRLHEQGQVVYRVMVGVDGQAKSATLVRSSGFERLDQASRSAVMNWAYVPGKKSGTPTAMSVDVPINWVLE